MILLIDNYDSFVYNLARYVKELGYERLVLRNNETTPEEIKSSISPTHIIISPGPCTPLEAGISVAIVKQLGNEIPLLGVCLGHQAIGSAFGATITTAKEPMHGMASTIHHNHCGLFQNLPNPLTVARYHSLIVSSTNFPTELTINAYSKKKEIMALQHKKYPLFGVQFHPESILTEKGHQLLNCFLKYKKNNYPQAIDENLES